MRRPRSTWDSVLLKKSPRPRRCIETVPDAAKLQFAVRFRYVPSLKSVR